LGSRRGQGRSGAGQSRARPYAAATDAPEFPDHLERRRIVHTSSNQCRAVAHQLSKIGEDVTGDADVVPRQLSVTEHVREKFSCRSCEKISQPPAPFTHPRGYAGEPAGDDPGRQYANHQPLKRQSEQCARGVELSVSTMAASRRRLCGGVAAAVELIKHHVFAAERLHGR